MENSLLEWLRTLELSRFVRCIEKDFASGFLFGDVLWRLELVQDLSAFQNAGTGAAQVQNFSALKKELGKLGITLSTAAMQNIIRGKPGAAAHLLSKLRETKLGHKEFQSASDTINLGLPKRERAMPRPRSVDASRRTPGSPSVSTGAGTTNERFCPSPTLQAATVFRKSQKPGSPSPIGVRVASDRTDVLESIDNFEMNLQRQGVCTSTGDMDVPYCVSTCEDVEQVLHTLYRKLPSMQTQADYNARLMERLHGNRQAQEAACYERSRRRQRLLMEQAQKCREVLDSHLTESVAAASNRRSAQCLKLVSTVARTRSYEKVLRCNLEVQKLLVSKQESKRQAVYQNHRQHAIATRAILTEAAVEEQARICRSLHTVRRALKRSRLISECELMAEQIVDLVLDASDYKARFDTATIAPRVWREWLARFVSPEDGFEAPVSSESREAANPGGIIVHIPASPPSVSVAAWHGDGPPAPLPAALSNEFKDYAQAEGTWSAIHEASAASSLPPLPPLTEFLASMVKTQETEEGPGAVAQDAAGQGVGDATDVPGVGGSPPEAKPASLYEPQLGNLGQLVRHLLEQTRSDPTPARPPGSPDVLLRIIITGKPASGNLDLARQLAARYKLEVLCLQSILQEAVNAASSVVEASTAPASDGLPDVPESEEGGATASSCGTSAFASLGAEAAQYLTAGSPLPDVLAVRLLVAKLHMLFPPEGREVPEEQLRRLFPPESDDPHSGRSASGSNNSSSNNKASGSKKSKSTKPLAGDRGNATLEAAGSDSPRCGWVLVGFPTTRQQYALLEERLSGFVEEGRRQPLRVEALKERSDLIIKMPKEAKKPEESHDTFNRKAMQLPFPLGASLGLVLKKAGGWKHANRISAPSRYYGLPQSCCPPALRCWW